MLPLGTYSFRVEGDWPLAGSVTLPVCAITRSQLAALLVTHEHPVRFPFEMDAPLPADIHDHPLDRARECPWILVWIGLLDRLATISHNVQPLPSNRQPDGLATDLALAHIRPGAAAGQSAVA